MMKYVDPFAAAIGGVSATISLVLGLPAASALRIGVVAFLVADVGRLRSALRGPEPGPAEIEEPPDTPLHPEEANWIWRADAAMVAIRRSVGTVGPGPMQDRLVVVAREAQHVFDDLRRVARQVTATRDASLQLDVPELSADLDRLTTTLQRSDDPTMVRDVQRSVDAVREQLRIGRRLEAARRSLHARIESGALGLQQLAAQVGEMTALVPRGGTWLHDERIDELTAQLDALLAGLRDADTMIQRANVIDPGGGDDAPIAP